LKGEIEKKNKIHKRIKKNSKEKGLYLKKITNHNYGSNDEIEKFDKKAKNKNKK
jgi:hypothetical protein